MKKKLRIEEGGASRPSAKISDVGENLGCRRKSRPSAKISAAGENLGRRRKSRPTAKISVACENLGFDLRFDLGFDLGFTLKFCCGETPRLNVIDGNKWPAANCRIGEVMRRTILYHRRSYRTSKSSTTTIRFRIGLSPPQRATEY